MKISYNKLWKLLIDKGMNKQKLKKDSGVSAASLSKMSKCGNINTSILLKICKTLHCKVEDIIETITD